MENNHIIYLSIYLSKWPVAKARNLGLSWELVLNVLHSKVYVKILFCFLIFIEA